MNKVQAGINIHLKTEIIKLKEQHYSLLQEVKELKKDIRYLKRIKTS